MRRKLSAVLMADVVGYSALMSRDESTTHEEVKACFAECIDPAVESLDGRIVRQMGDGVLAVFDSASNAVECGVAIHEAVSRRNQRSGQIPRLKFRIGINLGEVIHDGSDIFGDGVNIAARLESLAPSEGILISEIAYREVKRYLKYKFEFHGVKTLKNIADPVRTYSVLYREIRDPKDSDTEPLVGPAKERNIPTIAVLPFDDLGCNDIGALFIDGFVEDLITDLCRFHTLAVIARTSSFAFRDQIKTIQQISRLLGAQFIVEGSVRQIGKTMRIVVQLIDVDSERHIWAERYDTALEEVLSLQDEIISQIVGILERTLMLDKFETAKRAPPSDLQAYDYWLRGNKLMEEWSAELDIKAIPLFEKAIEIDPAFARPYSSLAAVYHCRNLLSPGNPNEEQDKKSGRQNAQKAISLDPSDARSQLNLGWSSMLDRNFAKSERHFNLAGKLNPHDPEILISRAIAEAFLGHPQTGLALATKAFELNPFHPDFYLGNYMIICFLAEHYDEAIETGEQTSLAWSEIAAWLAASYAHAGHLKEAREAASKFVNDMRAKWTGLQNASEADFVRWFFRVNSIKRETDRRRLISGFEIAGLATIDIRETEMTST